MSGFAPLGVPETIRDALDKMGYLEPTPVQRAAIPILLQGHDALVEAQTGSGKTAAYGVPAVVVGAAQRGLRVVVLVPTRELARQVADEIRELGTGSAFRAVAVTGGLTADAEERALGGDVRCVVATPGRLLALVESGRVRLAGVRLAVLDEADRMLDMGFREDVDKLLRAMPSPRQTILLSATLPRAVLGLARDHLREPQEVRVDEATIPAALAHHRLNVRQGEKEPALLALLRKEGPERAMVFVRTRERATAFTKLLKDAGLAADALQGGMTHDQRRHVFELFQRGTTRILVTTDLGSRGLDVPEMDLVVNVDLPDEDEQYLHRAGRAGRMGRPGRVVSLVLPDEKPQRLRLEALTTTWQPYRLTFAPLPPAEEPPPRRPAAQARKAPAKPAAKPPARAAPPRKTPARQPSPRRPPARDAPPRKAPSGKGGARKGGKGRR